MSSLFFNFYGIAGVQINTRDERAAAFFQAEYAFHQVDSLPPHLPRVILNYGGTPPPGLVLSRHTHKLLARWSYAIELSENRVTLFAVGNWFAVPMIHHMLVHSALRYLVSFQNTLLLHSGAVALNGQSILFTGPGGTGKTTTTSLLLSSPDQNWAVHADDYCFVRPGQGTLAYLTRAHLYRDLLSWLPGLRSRITPMERLGLEVFGRLRSWSDDRLKWAVRVTLDRLWPGRELCREAVPAALVLLKRGALARPELALIQPDSDVVDNLLQMNFYESRHFLNLLAKNCSSPSVEVWIDEWREREREILSTWIQQVPVYELILPLQRLSRESMAAQISKLFTSLIQPGVDGGKLG